eukprot:Protomagalhaensia_wolfi_Nauph_80__2115@NODE_2358_length_1115_cov_101_022305_g1847_i0_p1_GENE_NODE_2358_length_1115_cov_101_022305_g1847_i0NODE_2358_length_1115_cov_101_022305_g1847_i0_p1_ORF_typecomplete_len260_score63_90zfPARP/PF00645_18/1_3e14zfPARP/PF00645_18/9_4e03PADR1/PF08063_12/5_2e03PADR1/PF08063_12/5_9e03PADR1/PF08063_12/2_2e13SAP/PF02037_27/0_00055TF_Zn_Ribbon/PF08271_12/2_5e03TF_Zn_Ribbon/PF08271_12/0_05Uteroglobin/PF01099_17/1_8e04Uteroglobin/PF01099_17/0_096SRA1/PF07304_11/0_1YjeJ/P
MTFLWFIEKAKSGRSKCKGCQQAIAKDALRIGVKSESDGLEDRAKAIAEALRWYHFTIDCVRSFRKQASWWKTRTPELDEFEGLDGLGVRVSEELSSMLETLRDGGGAPPSRKRPTADSSEPTTATASGDEESPKKQAKTTTTAAAEEYNCPTLTEEQNADIKQRIDNLKAKTKNQLVAMLKENEQKTSGKKDELIERCAEGMVLGRLPICPQCDKAKVAFNRTSGEYYCPGSFDNGSFKCSFKSFQVQRGEWVGEDSS